MFSYVYMKALSVKDIIIEDDFVFSNDQLGLLDIIDQYGSNFAIMSLV
jgi:hypothetical protein